MTCPAFVRESKRQEDIRLDAEFAILDFDKWREGLRTESREAGRKLRELKKEAKRNNPK